MSPAPPPGLRVLRFDTPGGEFIVFSYPEADAPAWDLSVLTPAEQLVASLLLSGASRAEIAARRGVSLATIASQLTSLYDKFGVTTRAELVALLGATLKARG